MSATRIDFLRRRIAAGFAWSSAGVVIWRGLTALSSIVIARILGPVGFGELGLVRATANLFVIYADFRLGTTATKYVAEHRETNPDLAGRILRMTMVVSVIFCALAALALLLGGPFIAEAWLDNPALGLPLQIASGLLFFQAYSAMREAVLISTGNFPAYAKVQMTKGVFSAVLGVVGALFYGVLGAIAGLALASFAAYLVLQYHVRKALAATEIPTDVPFSKWKGQLRLVLSFALPGMIAGVLVVMALWWGRVVLSQADNGAVELGLFEAGNQWRTLVLFLPDILSRVALPFLAESHGKDQQEDFRDVVWLQYRAVLIVSLPLCVGVIVFAHWLMAIYGSAYTDVGLLLPFLMASVFVFGLNQALRKAQDGAGKRWQYLILQLFWAGAFLAALLTLEDGLDAERLALVWLISELAMWAVQMGYVELNLARGTIRNVGGNTMLAAVAIALACWSKAALHDGLAAYFVAALALLLASVPAATFFGKLLRSGRFWRRSEAGDRNQSQ